MRDANFRGAPVDATIQQWKSIRRGETLYIDPFRHNAAFTIDSYLPYETCILMNLLNGTMAQHAEAMRGAGLDGRAAPRRAGLRKSITCPIYRNLPCCTNLSGNVCVIAQNCLIFTRYESIIAANGYDGRNGFRGRSGACLKGAAKWIIK